MHSIKERAMPVQQITEPRTIDLRDEPASSHVVEAREPVQHHASVPTPPAFSEMLVLELG